MFSQKFKVLIKKSYYILIMIKNYNILNDIDIAKMAINEDKKALKELLLRVQKDTTIFLHYFDPDFISENDLMQIILLKVTNNIKNLKTPETFKKWSHKIIVNSYYDYARKINMLKRKIHYEFTNEQKQELAKTLSDKKNKPQDELLNMELKDKIQGAIMRLPKSHRMVILLRDMAGLTYEDIESILNINKGTVKSRLARARNKLKYELRNYL